mmetsp:Transcript_62701/g.115296  ORF Transcript_62701/g.115296 Transcript_62701/m.115296 type:complete len:544 (-) Transcript_62701:22-1653(-)
MSDAKEEVKEGDDGKEEVKEEAADEGEGGKQEEEEEAAADKGDAAGEEADEGGEGDEADGGDKEDKGDEGEEEDEGDEEEDEAEEETEEMRKASIEKAADKGFELRKRGEDKWNLRIRLFGFKLAVTDEYMEFYCAWLKDRLDKEKEEYGDDFLENARAEVDFSQTGLENSATALLLKTLLECKVQVWLLKLFKNRLSHEAMEALCEYLKDSEDFNTVKEIHLTHNKFENDSVLLLLRTLKDLKAYPPKKGGEGDDAAEPFPVWIRLDKNQVEDPEKLLETASEEGIETCHAEDRDAWTKQSYRAEGECPIAHLYGFMNQGFDGENPVGGPRAKGKGKEKRSGSGKGKGSGKKGEGKKGKGEGKTRDRDESKGEGKGKGKSKDRDNRKGGGKGGSGSGGSREKGGGGGRGWDDWSGGWGNWDNKGRQGGYGNKGYRNNDWDDGGRSYGNRDYGGYRDNWYDRDNWNSDYRRDNRGWDDGPRKGGKGYGGKGYDDGYKGGRDDGYSRDSYRGDRGDRSKGGPPRNRGWEEPRPPPRSKAEAWLG